MVWKKDWIATHRCCLPNARLRHNSTLWISSWDNAMLVAETMEMPVNKWGSINITRTQAPTWSHPKHSRITNNKLGRNSRSMYPTIKEHKSSLSKLFKTKNCNVGSKMSHMPTLASNRPFWSIRSIILESNFIRKTFQTVIIIISSNLRPIISSNSKNCKSNSFWWLKKSNTRRQATWCWWKSQTIIVNWSRHKGLSCEICSKMWTSWHTAHTCTQKTTKKSNSHPLNNNLIHNRPSNTYPTRTCL